jgi:uncharacterized low-complexity protein
MGAGAVRNLMQARLSGLSVVLRLAVAVGIAAAASTYSARAQEPKAGEPKAGEPKAGEPKAGAPKAGTPQADGPPVAIGGWRYIKGANDVYLFDCETAACVPGSRVSYRFYAAGTTMPLSQFRSEQETVVKALQQRAAPGTKITIVAIEGDDVDTLPRMYKARRLMLHPDGSQEHVHSGLLMGERASVSLISSSRDEKAATVGYAQYALGLMLSIQVSRDQKK